MWERQVYLFAQRRQLAALALYIPTKDPRLRGTAYRMVLDAFLLSAADHPRLLSLLHTWPPDLYSLPALTEAVVHRCCCLDKSFLRPHVCFALKAASGAANARLRRVGSSASFECLSLAQKG